MNWYAVWTREVCLHYGGGYEPDEYGSFFVYAKARTARRAKVVALRWFRRHEGWRWRWAVEGDGSPFRGMKAVRVPRLAGGDEE